MTLQKSWWYLTDTTNIKTDIFSTQKKILGCDQCTLESFKKNLVLEEIVFCCLNQQIMPSKIKDLIFIVLAVMRLKTMNMTLVSHHYIIKISKLFLVEKSDRWEKSFLKGRHFIVWISFMHSKTKDIYFSVGVVTQWCYRRG